MALALLVGAGKVLLVPWLVVLLHVVMAFGGPDAGKGVADLLAFGAVLSYPFVRKQGEALAQARLAAHQTRPALALLAVPVVHGSALVAIFIVRPLIVVWSGG